MRASHPEDQQTVILLAQESLRNSTAIALVLKHGLTAANVSSGSAGGTGAEFFMTLSNKMGSFDSSLTGCEETDYMIVTGWRSLHTEYGIDYSKSFALSIIWLIMAGFNNPRVVF
jgi:hypothetical protein